MDAQSPSPLANATRLATLRRTGLLDSPREESYDRLTRLAATALHTRIALMTLVDEDQHFFKSSIGLPEPWATQRRGSLDCSLCHHVVASGAPFFVEDARADPRVRESRAVAELSMVSYAGVPLRTQEGQVIGAFASADAAPRPWQPADVTILEELGATAMHEVELRGALRSARELARAPEAGSPRPATTASSVTLDASPVALCVLQDGLFQFATPSLAALFGYSEEELLAGMSMLDIAAEPARAELNGAFERLLAPDGSRVSHEFSAVRKDGTPIELELLGARAEIAGRPAIVACLLDVTVRRTSDTRLRRDVERLRSLTKYAWDVVHMLTPDDRILYISPSVERVLGYRPEEMMGRHSRDFVHPDDLPSAERAFKEDINRPGAKRRIDLRLRHKDGSWREVEVVGQVIADAEGGASVAIVNTHDVTEQRRTDRELRQKTASLELLEFVAAVSNAATSIDDAIRPCLERICTHNSWQAAHLCLRDAAGNMVSTGTWYLSDPERLAPFREKTDASVFAPGVGLPGKVMETGATTWMPDVTQDESFTRLAEARASGLKGGLACPVLVGTQVVGALEFFAERVLELDAPLTELLSHVGSQLGRVIERGQAREAVLKSENRIRSIMERAHDAFVATDQQGTISEWNQRAEVLFGWSRDEAIGRSMTETIIPASQRAGHRRVIRQLLRSRKDAPRSRRLEIQALHREGHEFPAELSISAIPSDGGFLITSFLHDITARKQAEERLRCSEERYDLVARATSDIVWDWNVVSGVLTWNKALQRTCRYQPDQIGSTMEWWYNHIHPADRERVVTGTHAVLNGTNELWSDEYRLRRGDGTYATVLARGHVVRNGLGEAVRMIGSMVDITERKLEEQSQRFIAQASALLDTSLDQEVILDSLARLVVPTLADLCLIDVLDEAGIPHRAAETHLEPAREAPVRELPSAQGEAVNQLLVTRVVRGRQALLMRDCSESALEMLRFAEGERDAVKRLGVKSLMVVPLIAREQVLGAITLGLDDSSRRYDLLDLLTAEQLAQRAARTIDNGRLYDHAQRAIHARDEVLALVSHDLRNPLTTISLSASSLIEEHERQRTQAPRFLGVIKRSAEQANAMIRNLLDVSTIEAGHFSVQRQPMDVRELMKQACEMLTPLAEDRAIRLVCVSPPEAVEISVDPSQLDRVISNLVGNALKFTPRDGVVTFSAEVADGELRFSVADTGPGMPPDQVPHVFDRFWQGRPGDRRGAGLGLSIARGIVTAHGGRVWLESKEGKGTTVYFTIPMQGSIPDEAGNTVNDEPDAARESAHQGTG